MDPRGGVTQVKTRVKTYVTMRVREVLKKSTVF